MIYDVSLPLSPALAAWPGDPRIQREGFGDEVKISRWCLGSHAGTHVDAPAHFSLGATVDQLDPAALIGPCRVLNLPDVPLITADVLAAHHLIGVERLLLRTRNSRQWAEDPATFDPDFVGLDEASAHMLLGLGIKLLGVDGLSVEPEEGDGTVHELLLTAGVVIVEGLNLSAVPAGDYQLICAPLKLESADGAPARVFLVS
ncbi:MAG: cyclase family protein [Armatimonadota bacterium]